MKACLVKLGLTVTQESGSVPSLSQIHLSAARPSDVSELLDSWYENGIIIKEAHGEYIKGENDTFVLEQDGVFEPKGLEGALPDNEPENGTAATQSGPEADKLIDYTTLPKRLVTHSTSIPSNKTTPSFSQPAYFSALGPNSTFGKILLYGEVVTSTSTLLEKNTTLLSHLPTGTTFTATTQLAGRGRGTNVWVSPPGSLMFSTVLRHPLSLNTSAPVVFVQYLAALAIVAGIHGYESGSRYSKMPVKLKWPNDIYALDPTAGKDEEKYVKIGGILVNSSYSGGDYTMVVGIGLNVLNAAPTTSLSALARKLSLPPLPLEKLLASILTHFERLYTRFCRTGWDKHFEELYYGAWLHSEQIVTLETEGGMKARIKGISSDWGLLVAEELGWEDRPTGRRVQLQSDSNSFDFFRGLVKRKM